MKKVFFFLVLCFVGVTGHCQTAKRDSVANRVEGYVQTVNKAADVFLNRQLPPEERLKAIAPYPFVYEDRHVQPFKRTVLSSDERAEIRAMALNKIYQHVQNDESFFNQIVEWFGNPDTPKVLRDETLNLIGSLSFSSLVGILEVYHKMVEDPDVRFRAFAVAKLMMHGDPRAQQRLIQSLENPQQALFEPAQAIELLSLAPKKEFYPAVYKVLLESDDELARLTALQTLGPYKEAREKIVAISQDPQEKDDFRVSALMALYSGDKDNIINYVTPILRDRSASVRLQTLGIQMTTDVRKSMAYRKSEKAKRADEYDLLVKSIYDRQGVTQSEELRDMANKYLLSVRPNFN
jgi:hypothetical protein